MAVGGVYAQASISVNVCNCRGELLLSADLDRTHRVFELQLELSTLLDMDAARISLYLGDQHLPATAGAVLGDFLQPPSVQLTCIISEPPDRWDEKGFCDSCGIHRYLFWGFGRRGNDDWTPVIALCTQCGGAYFNPENPKEDDMDDSDA